VVACQPRNAIALNLGTLVSQSSQPKPSSGMSTAATADLKDKDPATISQARADAAKAYLVSKGIDAARLTTQSYGADWAKEATTAGASEPKNRKEHRLSNDEVHEHWLAIANRGGVNAFANWLRKVPSSRPPGPSSYCSALDDVAARSSTVRADRTNVTWVSSPRRSTPMAVFLPRCRVALACRCSAMRQEKQYPGRIARHIVRCREGLEHSLRSSCL
jgi:hypothetical protein